MLFRVLLKDSKKTEGQWETLKMQIVIKIFPKMYEHFEKAFETYFK